MSRAAMRLAGRGRMPSAAGARSRGDGYPKREGGVWGWKTGGREGGGRCGEKNTPPGGNKKWGRGEKGGGWEKKAGRASRGAGIWPPFKKV